MIRRTNEEYIALLEKDGKFEALETYKGSTKRTLHRCIKCSYEWQVRPQQLLRPGSGCPKCTSWKNPIDKVLKTLSEANMELLSEYYGSLKPIKLKHKYCGYQWETKYSYIQQGSGRPKCNKGYGYRIANNLPEVSFLYVFDIITFDGEHFLKVGITSQPLNKRINSISSQVGNILAKIKPICVLKGSGKEILRLEDLIHSDKSLLTYTSKHCFDGKTELKMFEEKDRILSIIERNRSSDTIYI